jgi:uncharacterized coiled-coil protein SlyX
VEKNKTSNIVSLDWKRRQVQDKETRYSRHRSGSLEGRMAALEEELDRVIGVVVDVADLAEANRDHLLTLLKKLKENKYL